MESYPVLFHPALAKLKCLRPSDFETFVERVPATWMSDSARKFAFALMSYNLGQLRSIRQ